MKRIVSLLLTVVLLCTLLSVVAIPAFAAGEAGEGPSFENYQPISTLEELKAFFAEGGVGYLTNDITADGTLTVSANASLCLNDKVLDLDGKGNIIVAEGVVFSVDGSPYSSEAESTVRCFDKDEDGHWALVGQSDASVKGGVILGGKAKCGGCFYVNDESSLLLKYVNLVGHAASGDPEACGGAIYAKTGSNVNISNTTIAECSAEKWGGAILSAAASSVTLNNSLIKKCKTDSRDLEYYGGGGGICSHGDLSLTQSTVSECHTIGFGGGILILYEGSQCNLTMLSAQVLNCSAYGEDSENHPGYSGGGIFIAGANASLSDCTVSCNNANKCGGGIVVADQNEKSGRIFLKSSVVSCNNAMGETGVACINSGDIVLGGSLKIIDNNDKEGNSNLCLKSGNPIRLDRPANDMNVGVTLDTGTGVFTKQLKEVSPRYFFADDSSLMVENIGNTLKLVSINGWPASVLSGGSLWIILGVAAVIAVAAVVAAVVLMKKKKKPAPADKNGEK